jgi:hypothetical protein
MTTSDRIRQFAAMGFVVATGVYLHAGAGAQLALAQTRVPGGFPQFGPNHVTEPPGFGLPTSPIVPNFGIDPVQPGPAKPHSRTTTAFFPMVPDSRLTFGSAIAADTVAIGGFGFGGFGYGGFGYGGFDYSGIGVSTSLPPMPELGPGTYRAGNRLPDSTVGMGMAGGNPADPVAGNGGQISLGAASEDAFDNAANGRPSATRPVRSNRVTAARRPSVRKPTPQPSRKVEARGTDVAPSRLGAPSARPQQADRPQERPSAVKSEETKSPPRRSMLGPPQ